MSKLLNNSAGYGEITNLITMKRVYLITHHEGIGTEECPMKEVRTYFDEEGKMLDRISK